MNEQHDTSSLEMAIAIVGLSLRVPGAPDERRFWSNLASGVETSILDLARTINELTGNTTPLDLRPARDWDRFELMRRMVDAGDIGRKSGQGFYEH